MHRSDSWARGVRRLAMATGLWSGALAAAAPAQSASPPTDEWYLTTADSVRLYVREIGAGEPVVVLHGGFGAEHGYLVPALQSLADRTRFVFYDQRGSLRSPAAPARITVPAHIADVDRLRQSLGLKRVTLVAHSMGTLLAMLYLDAHPDRVKGLVLLGAIPPATGPGGSDSLFAGVNRAATAMGDRPERLAEQRRLGLHRPNLSDREATHAWRIQFAAVNLYHVDRWRQMEGAGRVFYSQQAASAAAKTMPGSWDFRPRLEGHPCAVFVLNGDEDYVDFGARHWKAAAERVPGLRLRPMAHAGHSAWIDQPEQFHRHLREALDAAAACAES